MRTFESFINILSELLVNLYIHVALVRIMTSSGPKAAIRKAKKTDRIIGVFLAAVPCHLIYLQWQGTVQHVTTSNYFAYFM